ncbi:hypothetical protein [Nocardioides kribbensis]|uniref:hypothetical protein n=1 Tax=Nocardioides kribbensis TaxID=305517 RepID=UPI001879BFB5|nr:hypothetical protein [Nocardioides kribbensis]
MTTSRPSLPAAHTAGVDRAARAGRTAALAVLIPASLSPLLLTLVALVLGRLP